MEEKIGDKKEKRKERLKIKKKLLDATRCTKCHKPIPELLQSSDFEPHKIDGEQVCKNCWCESVGDEIEKRPIGVSPVRAHGCA